MRCANVPSDAGKGHRIFEDLHGLPDGASFANYLRDEVTKNYGYPLRDFLRWLVSNKAAVERDSPAFLNHFVDRVAGAASPEVKRTARRFASIAGVGELATEAGITGWPKGEASCGIETCFRDYIAQRGTTGESDTEKAISKLLLFIEQEGASRFQQFDERLQRVAKRAGFIRHTPEGTEYIFLPYTFRKEICAGADHKRMMKELIARGMLVVGSDGYRKKMRIPALNMAPQDFYVVFIKKSTDAEV